MDETPTGVDRHELNQITREPSGEATCDAAAATPHCRIESNTHKKRGEKLPPHRTAGWKATADSIRADG